MLTLLWKVQKWLWSWAFCFCSLTCLTAYIHIEALHKHKLAAFWAGSPVVGNWLCPLCKAAAAERRSLGADREKANKFPLVFSNLFHVLTIWPRGRRRRTIKQCSSARRQTSIVVAALKKGNQQILLKRSALCSPRPDAIFEFRPSGNKNNCLSRVRPFFRLTRYINTTSINWSSRCSARCQIRFMAGKRILMREWKPPLFPSPTPAGDPRTMQAPNIETAHMKIVIASHCSQLKVVTKSSSWLTMKARGKYFYLFLIRKGVKYYF